MSYGKNAAGKSDLFKHEHLLYPNTTWVNEIKILFYYRDTVSLIALQMDDYRLSKSALDYNLHILCNCIDLSSSFKMQIKTEICSMFCFVAYLLKSVFYSELLICLFIKF